jgi:hypothetical protein
MLLTICGNAKRAALATLSVSISFLAAKWEFRDDPNETFWRIKSLVL